MRATDIELTLRIRQVGRLLSILLGLLLLALPVAGSSEEVTRSFNRTIPFPAAGGQVSIDHRLGDVEIRTHGQANVIVDATIKTAASSKERATELSKAITIIAEPVAGGVRIRTDYPESHGRNSQSFSVDYRITIPANASLDLSNRFGKVDVAGLGAPGDIRNAHGALTFRNGKGTQKIENAFGRIDAEGISGDAVIHGGNGAVHVAVVSGHAEIENRFGAIDVRDLRHGGSITGGNGSIDAKEIGGSLEITNSFGAVEVAKVSGDLEVANANGRVNVDTVTGKADLKTSFGAVSATNVKRDLTVRTVNSRVQVRNIGGRADIENTFGAVTVSNVGGPTRISNANGNVEASDLRGDTEIDCKFGLVKVGAVTGSLGVVNANGGITANNVSGGVKVRTSFGPVFLERIGGDIHVENQNGAISVAGVASGQCRNVQLRTSFSPIRLTLPPDASYRVNARTSFGRVSTAFPITSTGSMSEGSLSGQIGGGKCTLELSNSNGSIQIEKE